MVLGELAQLGALDIAWRVLDAQWFGLAQRRARLFIVVDFGGERAGQILFEPEGGSRNPPPRRASGERPPGARTPGAHPGSYNGQDAYSGHLIPTVSGPRGGRSGEGGFRQDLDTHGAYIPVAFGGNNTSGPIDVSAGLNAKGGSGRMDFDTETFIAHTLTGEGFDASEDGTGRGTPLVPVLTPTLTSNGDQHSGFRNAEGLVAYQCQGTNVGEMGTLRSGNGHVTGGVPFVAAFSENQRAETRLTDYARQITTGGGKPGQGYPAVLAGMAVRRLTPTECERLQGFPDGWTAYGADGKPQSDSTRYRQLGNAVAVPVIEWIGRRILETA